MIELFLLLVDRDGVAARRNVLDTLEERSRAELPNDRILLAENAWQELEVWALAGLTLPTKWNWQDIRREVHPKETYFDVLARQRGVANGPGGGRKAFGDEAAANYKRIRSRCKEDLAALEKRIREWVDAA